MIFIKDLYWTFKDDDISSGNNCNSIGYIMSASSGLELNYNYASYILGMSHDSSGNNCNSIRYNMSPSIEWKLNYNYTSFIIGMSHDSSGNNCDSNGYIMSPSRGTKGTILFFRYNFSRKHKNIYFELRSLYLVKTINIYFRLKFVLFGGEILSLNAY